VQVHYEDHHKAYYSKLKEALGKLSLDPPSLEWLLRNPQVAGDPELAQSIRVNGGQYYNHILYWQSLGSPNQTVKEVEPLDSLLRDTFGSLDNFISEVIECALGVVGSGWCWLTYTAAGTLELQTTQNEESPIMLGMGYPCWCLDVWEHAYYIDYLSERESYSQTIATHLINWTEVNRLLISRRTSASP
jgi:Fe-Mn family superoxide dismutase